MVSETGTVYWGGKTWAVGEAFAGLEIVLEANPEPRAKADTRLVRFADVKLGVIGDHACGRLRPTACDDHKRGKSCTRKPTKR